MFFQYSNALSMKQQHWGHARSRDLVNWEEMPEAMQCDMMGKIYTGSCVVDEDNTTGFFTDNVEGESKLVAVFTHCDGMEDYYGFSKQSIAFSKDHGLTWEKYSGNPVINNLGNIYGHGFRDPKVVKLPCIWTKTSYIWTMFCGADGIAFSPPRTSSTGNSARRLTWIARATRRSAPTYTAFPWRGQTRKSGFS